MTKTRITADVLRDLPDEEVKRLLTELGPQKAEELQHDWPFWARDTQLLPSDNKDPRLVEKGLTKTQWNTWVCLAGRGWGKDLKVSTPVFTPGGWTTMGEIGVGDYVFAWDGSPTKVVDTYRPNPRELVKFHFSDGTELTSSVEHDWVTWTHSERKCYNRNVGNGIPEDWPNWFWEYKDRWGHTRNQIGPKKRTTQDIVDTFTHGKRKDRNHSIPLAKPLQGSHKEHLEDPYYLGLWLGDGLSDSVHTMACGKEDEWWLIENYPSFESKGNCVYRAPAGSFPFMNALGLRKNKHFDEGWLQASFEQRLLLLQGLMDSDGCADKSGVEFCSTNRSLANGVLLLARTLGQKPTLLEGVARLYGKDCGPKYRVTWRPTQGINPFRLPRKSNKVSFGGAQESRNLHRMIVGYEFVDYEPTVCISVEHKDHLFLAGEGLIPTHNTKAGVETVREWVKQGNGIIHCVAPTKGDVRKVMVEGDSGLLNSCWKGDRTHRGAAMGYPTWSPTNNTLTWENGAKAVFFSAEDPERLRGPQAHKAWCFTAGTKILTSTGEIPVESVTVGTLVQTSKGLHPVVATSKRPMTVGQVVFSDGRTLTGTYDHPIMTEGGQWVPLGDLEEGDKICAIDVLSSKESCSTTTAAAITKELGTTEKVAIRGLLGCIGLFGRVLWDRSLRDTTKTKTSSTITLTTSNAFLESITAGTTTLRGVVSQGSQSLMESSSARTVTQQSFVSRLSTVKTWFVNLAATKGPTRREKLLETVDSAVRRSSQGLETIVLSVVSTWRPKGEQYVYNLQVDEVHEYIANGVFTHNCDEICAWNNAQETWDMMQFGLRLGQHPQTLVTTTPKPTKLIRNILADDKTIISRGSTYDNAANLADTFLEAVRKQYEGTRLGRQELYAEILDEASGALWSRSLLASCEIDRDQVPDLRRIVVSIDPAITSNAESDMTGIVVAGVDINGTAYVLEDATGKYTPQQWASKAVELFEAYEADRVVAEKNQGGDMVKHTLHTECPTLPIKLVHASRGKMARAEPVSALYEQGRVKHVKGLNDLEDQMVQWEPLGSIGSPDRLDAMVWAITDLSLKGWAKPTMQLAYSSAVGLLRG